MPRTKLQEIVYAVLMTLFMVLAITRLRMGGMTNAGFFTAFSEMRIMVPVCFVMGIFSWSGSSPKSPLKW